MNHRHHLRQYLDRGVRNALLCAALACLGGHAIAAVTISAKPTKNITCNADNVCTPAATSAVLNANDLMNMLAVSSVVISTSPAASGVATNIVISAPLTWPTTSVLTLDSYSSVTVNSPVSLTGSGGLIVMTNDGGDSGLLSFGGKGSVTFANLGGGLVINNEPYVLVNSPDELAQQIAGNPSGNYALAAPYDASGESYFSAVVAGEFTGKFEGLGNRIAHLTIHDTQAGDPAALFAHLGAGGELHDVELATISVSGTSPVGGVVAVNDGLVTGSIIDGSVSAKLTDATAVGNTMALIVGGLVGQNNGMISYSHATPTVTGTLNDAQGLGIATYAGGLVGLNNGPLSTILAAWAGGPVKLTVASKNAASENNNVGGLVGLNVRGFIVNYSFAVGPVTFDGTCIKCGSTTGLSVSAGGLVGTNNNGGIFNASASGSVVAGNYGTAGGLVGTNQNVIACGCGIIEATVATGNVSASIAGGLLGYNYQIPVSDSYSSGLVSGGLYSYDSVGGFLGFDGSPTVPPAPSYFTNDGWDETTSGSASAAGNFASEPGVTGTT
jgi:hypothetical protein